MSGDYGQEFGKCQMIFSPLQPQALAHAGSKDNWTCGLWVGLMLLSKVLHINKSKFRLSYNILAGIDNMTSNLIFCAQFQIDRQLHSVMSWQETEEATPRTSPSVNCTWSFVWTFWFPPPRLCLKLGMPGIKLAVIELRML
jgi:hypothetical protein